MAGGSQQIGRAAREKESGFVRVHTCDVLDDMSAILQVIPSFFVFFFFVFVLKSVKSL